MLKSWDMPRGSMSEGIDCEARWIGTKTPQTLPGPQSFWLSYVLA